MSTVDLLLHPVRLRILQAFLGNRELTTVQLAAEMGDIPASRIYRHIALLLKAGVLVTASERQLRGGTERTYALGLKSTVNPTELRQMNYDDHLQAFTAFVAGLLAGYERYLSSGKPDPVRDGVSYSMNALWLSDEEYAGFLKDVVTVVTPRTTLKPSAERRRRLIASAFMPLPDKKEHEYA